METAMADVPVEVKKTAPTQTNVPDVWNSFRGEMDRLFDRFGFPSLRRVFDIEPSWRSASSFSFSTPAIDMSEDDRPTKSRPSCRALILRISMCRYQVTPSC